MKKIIKVGSRESNLALAQTNWVIDEIKKKHPEYEFEIIKIKTKGDKILDKRLDKIGGKGLFIKELEECLINREIDIAVHSMKDMPTEIPEELSIDVVSKREDPRDIVITLDNTPIDELPSGSILGTSSLRREVQILELNKGLQIKTLRGNVNTRIGKLINKEYDAIILAAAGLKRLGIINNYCVQYLEVDKMIPSVGQGILCVETRKGENIDYLMDSVHCEESEIVLKAERTFMISLNGGCSMPIAAHAVIKGDEIRVSGMITSYDQKKVYIDEVVGDKSQASKLGEELAERLKRRERKIYSKNRLNKKEVTSNER